MMASPVAAHTEPLKAIGMAIVPRPYPDLAFSPSPPRAFAYTRHPFHHVCDDGIWRPDDRMSHQCAKWLTDGGGRMLLTLDGPRAAVELSQGAFMLKGLRLLDDVGTDYGMVDRLVREDEEWWGGFFFACVHFGVDAWAVNVDSGRVARATNSSCLCLSHLTGDGLTGQMEEFFEYKEGDVWLLSVAAAMASAERNKEWWDDTAR